MTSFCLSLSGSGMRGVQLQWNFYFFFFIPGFLLKAFQLWHWIWSAWDGRGDYRDVKNVCHWVDLLLHVTLQFKGFFLTLRHARIWKQPISLGRRWWPLKDLHLEMASFVSRKPPSKGNALTLSSDRMLLGEDKWVQRHWLPSSAKTGQSFIIHSSQNICQIF